jgi:signal transduction histidine kinase
MRLQAEKVSDVEERKEVLGQVDRLEEAIDQLILSARSERSVGPSTCDLSAITRARCAFWSVLADEQGRTMSLEVDTSSVEVGLSSEAVEAMIDALIGNVFAHTPPGTPFGVAAGSDSGRPWLEVHDEGTGFGRAGLASRGVSGAGSTGLGLDIVRRTAELAGGSMEMNNRPGKGAVVRVWLGAGY